MRRTALRKLRSQRGATMLLALLFLLICVMVSAAILMAAASNAGKHRSNLEQHQTYLALSSAVSLLCDELKRAEYRGQYCYWEVVVDEYDAEGHWIGSHTDRYFRQTQGAYDSALSEMLRNDFDNLFQQEVENRLDGSGILDQSDPLPPASFTHTLTLFPNTGVEVLDSRKVHVTLEITEAYAMYLTANLDGDDAYTLRAELTPITNIPILTLPLTPHGQAHVQQMAPVQWKIGWITVGEEEEAAP